MCYLKHFINGLYSGIPLCCVVYFLTLGNENQALKDMDRKGIPYKISHDGFQYLNNIDIPSEGLDYIQCPKCHGKNKVTIKNNGVIFDV